MTSPMKSSTLACLVQIIDRPNDSSWSVDAQAVNPAVSIRADSSPRPQSVFVRHS